MVYAQRATMKTLNWVTVRRRQVLKRKTIDDRVKWKKAHEKQWNLVWKAFRLLVSIYSSIVRKCRSALIVDGTQENVISIDYELIRFSSFFISLWPPFNGSRWSAVSFLFRRFVSRYDTLWRTGVHTQWKRGMELTRARMPIVIIGPKLSHHSLIIWKWENKQFIGGDAKRWPQMIHVLQIYWVQT